MDNKPQYNQHNIHTEQLTPELITYDQNMKMLVT